MSIFQVGLDKILNELDIVENKSLLHFLAAGWLREHPDDSRGLPVPHGQEEEEVREASKNVYINFFFYNQDGA